MTLSTLEETTSTRESEYFQLKSLLNEEICNLFSNSEKTSSILEEEIVIRLAEKCNENGQLEHVYNDIYLIVTTCVTKCSDKIFNISFSFTNNLAKSICLVHGVHELMSGFGNAIHKLFPLIQYINVHFATEKSFEIILLNLFKDIVVEPHAVDIIKAIKRTRKTSFSVDPSILFDLVNSLHKLMPGIHRTETELFSCYVPNVKKPCSEMELEHEIMITKQLADQLKTNPDFQRL